MGMVLEAREPTLERRVAIKILHSHWAKDPSVCRRFINEARAVNKVRHRAIVDITEHGILDDGTPYLVMEYIEGETVNQLLKRSDGALPWEEAIRIGHEAAEALSVAHAADIVHRDLKPDNIMIAVGHRGGTGKQVKLLDFGIAKVRGGAGATETKVGLIMGTPTYMAPEQVLNTAGVDGKADVYSLGIVLYQLISGQPPFESVSTEDLFCAHVGRAPAPLCTRAKDVPAEVGAFIDGMIRKVPKDRPTMAEVAERLGAMLASPQLTPAQASSTSGSASELLPMPQPQRRNRLALVMAIGLVLLPSVGVGLWMFGKRSRPQVTVIEKRTPQEPVPRLSPLDQKAAMMAAVTQPELAQPVHPTAPAVPESPEPESPVQESPKDPPAQPDTVCQKVNATPSCVDSPLTGPQRRAVKLALETAPISVCVGERVRLADQGGRPVFWGTLRGALTQQHATDGVPREVILQCAR